MIKWRQNTIAAGAGGRPDNVTLKTNADNDASQPRWRRGLQHLMDEMIAATGPVTAVQRNADRLRRYPAVPASDVSPSYSVDGTKWRHNNRDVGNVVLEHAERLLRWKQPMCFGRLPFRLVGGRPRCGPIGD